ncbi:hypothetical protein ACLQ25_29665 [Micromonospora sp. DT44]|uniref:hypothetical protein n=1 Tax=Micromonospora sp. DT44 TaxID=3393439 RepID=UPI003CF4F55B
MLGEGADAALPRRWRLAQYRLDGGGARKIALHPGCSGFADTSMPLHPGACLILFGLFRGD